jgi:NAD-dependent dihydropyrimidine dehydrogenase PreA subunit
MFGPSSAPMNVSLWFASHHWEFWFKGSLVRETERTWESEVEDMRRYGVIVDKCIKDLLCISACLREALHPLPNEPGFANAAQLFINPRKCIGCGSCMSACESGAIFEVQGLPRDLERFAAVNADYYRQ